MKEFPAASEKKRRRPMRFMEEVGLECCLWPHLYWTKDCFATLQPCEKAIMFLANLLSNCFLLGIVRNSNKNG